MQQYRNHSKPKKDKHGHYSQQKLKLKSFLRFYVFIFVALKILSFRVRLGKRSPTSMYDLLATNIIMLFYKMTANKQQFHVHVVYNVYNLFINFSVDK